MSRIAPSTSVLNQYVFSKLFAILLCNHTGYKDKSHPHELNLYVFSNLFVMLLYNHTDYMDISHPHDSICIFKLSCLIAL